MKKTLLFLLLFLLNFPTFAQNPADIDQAFGFHPGFNGSVYATAIQADGKIIAGGSFTKYQGITEKCLIRLNPDGSKDTSFNKGTISSTVKSILVQPDGKILVGCGTLFRLNPNGTPDTSFNIGSGFKSFATLSINSILLQPDGKIIVGGDFASFQGISQYNVIRLNSDGSKDTSFDIGTGFQGDVESHVYSICLQPDGKIIVGGSYHRYQGSYQGSLIRLNADGSKDTSFTSLFSSSDKIYSIAVQPDGKIIIGGDFDLYYNGAYQEDGLIRLNADGSKDTSFDAGDGHKRIYSTTIQPDGKIIIGGYIYQYNELSLKYLIRLNPDGSIDSSFDTGNGFASEVIDSTSISVFSTTLQPNGKIIAGGAFTTYKGSTKNGLVQINPDGSIDKSFGVGTGYDKPVLSIVTQSDSKIIVGGAFTSYQGITQNRIIRLKADGEKDTSFDIGTGNTNTGFDNTVNCIALQPDGKILVGGYFTKYKGTSHKYLIRLNPDGSNDTSFTIGTGFASSVAYYFELYITCIAIQPDGKIIVGGHFGKYQGVKQQYLTRLNPNGSIDTSFNIGTGFDGTVNCVAIQPDGKILVGGEFHPYQKVEEYGLIRLNPDGSKDTSFKKDIGISNDVYCIAIQPDNKIIVGGRFDYDLTRSSDNLTRLNSDGTKDPSFDIGTDNDVMNDAVRSLAIQKDGKILVGGNSTRYKGGSQNHLIRFNSDGSKDTSFDIGTGFEKSIYDNYYDDSVNAIALQPDGSIMAGGDFTKYNGNASAYLTLLKGTYIQTPLIATTTQTNVICAGYAIGSASVSDVYGGKRPYTYLWSNGATTATATGLADGTYTCTITDADSTTLTKSFTITTIADTKPPTVIAPPTITVNANENCIGTGVVLDPPVTDDNCAVVSVTNNAPTSFPIGTTYVGWTIKDASNNTISIVQTVIVKDVTPPTIIPPAAITVNAGADGKAKGVALGTPITSDCTAQTVTKDSPLSYPLGNTTVTWTVKDKSNNIATATQIVTVVDVTPPTITAPATVIVNATSNCTATGVALGTPVTADNCSVASVTNDAPTTFPIGDTTVTWTVTDGSNNKAMAIQSVIVTGPDATIKNDSGVLSVAENGASYQWKRCENNELLDIPNQNSKIYSPENPGSYAVVVTKNGCPVTSSCVEVTTLGTNRFDMQDAVRLQPNPTNGNVTIEMTSSENKQLNVFDVTGRFLFSKELKGVSTTLDISNLPNGVYMFRISNESETVTRRVVKD